VRGRHAGAENRTADGAAGGGMVRSGRRLAWLAVQVRPKFEAWVAAAPTEEGTHRPRVVPLSSDYLSAASRQPGGPPGPAG
jgi:hypothetical protein